jgi:hypothetical protein
MALLHNIDLFVSVPKDKKTASTLGGILTILLPIIVLAYVGYQYIETDRARLSVELSTVRASDTVHTVTIKCISPLKCYYSAVYPPGGCLDNLKKITGAVSDVCVVMNYGAELDIPFCYTGDPAHGPTFLWARDQSCGSSVQDATESCPAGVAIKLSQYGYDTATGEWKKYTLIVGAYRAVRLKSRGWI